MKTARSFFTVFLIIFAFITNGIPCGPAYISPIFVYESAPENPYENFAAGSLGIIKPKFHRSVLFAAYRYLTGGTFTPDEQKGLVEAWKAEFDNKSYTDNDVTETVRAWVQKRKDVVGSDATTPDIYVERNYGGYDFFPNCTKNAFETAIQTLSDRISSYGSDNKDVKEWLEGQDRVFSNCSTGKQSPRAVDPAMPAWLQKDRAYQLAAASFYSLDYKDAKRRFDAIAEDMDSPWQETAVYLVSRTLIRDASLSKSTAASNALYEEAEKRLESFSSSSKFSDAAERMLGLVKYRLHPRQRLAELSRKLQISGGNPNFRQDLIDYTWLMDKFEKEILEAEQKRKESEKPAISNNVNRASNMGDAANEAANAANTESHEGQIQIYLYIPETQQSFNFFVDENATDDEAIAEAEKVIGRPLTDVMKKTVRENRQSGYAARFSSRRQSEYPGGYYGEEDLSLSLLPAFIKQDDMTDWLYTYQIADPETYLHSLSKFRETGSDLWLMTAISRADKNSTQLAKLLDAGRRVSHLSPAYDTITYHVARLLLESGRSAEAKKILDDVLNSSDDMPISTRNQFLDLRLTIAETLDDFLRYSLRKPFAFDLDGSTGSIDEFVEEEKTWFDPDNTTQTREEYEREIEDNFKDKRLWQDRWMFDSGTVDLMNENFPLSVLQQVERSEAIPDYLRERFAIPIWTRAVLLGDLSSAQKIAPELVRLHPEFEPFLTRIANAKTPAARDHAVLFFILKNPVLGPLIADGLGKGDNEFGEFDSNDWWCTSYDIDFSDEGENTNQPTQPPKFLTAAQLKAAKDERAKLKEIGDAPAFLGRKVLEWAARSPADRRIPESLYITYKANGWTKYGCGNNEELHNKIGAFLKRRYPGNEWTQKLIAEGSENQ
jgi:hypothetical protein